MSLYDNYQQANSQAVSQFVGSALPDIKEIGARVMQDYDEAAESDDQLTEALSNLQHLGIGADSQYAEELKEQYKAKLDERAGQGDYENMGRRTKRDAMRFVQEYTPLMQRQAAISEHTKKIQDDEDIFSDQDKALLVKELVYNNSPKKGENGDYERDASGKIVLGSVQTNAYAKDVDITKELTDFLSKVETTVRQSGFYSDGTGLKISNIAEMRDPAKLAQLGDAYMKANPKIKAMVDRNVRLRTFDASASDYADYASKNNLSTYEKLKKMGLSEKDIIKRAGGVDNVEALRTKPIDGLVEAGYTKEQAQEQLYKSNLSDSMYSDAVSVVAEALGVDKQTLVARSDVNYEVALKARAAAELEQTKKLGDITLMRTAEFDVRDDSFNIEELDSLILERDKVNTHAAGILGNYLAGVGGVPPISDGDTKDDVEKRKIAVDNFLANDTAIKAHIASLRESGDPSKVESAGFIEDAISTYRASGTGLDDLVRQRQAGIDATKKGNKGKTYKQGYNTLRSKDNNSSVNIMNSAVTEQVMAGNSDFTDVVTGKKFNQLPGRGLVLKDDLGDSLGDRKYSNASVYITSRFSYGKPIVIANLPDGNQRALISGNFNQSEYTEIAANLIKGAGLSHSEAAARTNAEEGYRMLGEMAMDAIGTGGIKRMEASSAPQLLSSKLGLYVKVVGGSEGETQRGKGAPKIYRMMVIDPVSDTRTFVGPQFHENNTDAIAIAIGKREAVRENIIQPEVPQAMMRTRTDMPEVN